MLLLIVAGIAVWAIFDRERHSKRREYLILLNVVKRIAADKEHYLCICKEACDLSVEALKMVRPSQEEINASYSYWFKNEGDEDK